MALSIKRKREDCSWTERAPAGHAAARTVAHLNISQTPHMRSTSGSSKKSTVPDPPHTPCPIAGSGTQSSLDRAYGYVKLA